MVNLKKATLITSILLWSASLTGQTQTGITHTGRSTGQSPFPITSYTELENPVKTDSALWQKIKLFNVSWVQSVVKRL